MRRSARCLASEECRRLDREEGPVGLQRAQGPVAVQARGQSRGAVQVVSFDLDGPIAVDVEAEGQRRIEFSALAATTPLDVGKQDGVVSAGLEPRIQAIRRQRVASFAERQALREDRRFAAFRSYPPPAVLGGK